MQTELLAGFSQRIFNSTRNVNARISIKLIAVTAIIVETYSEVHFNPTMPIAVTATQARRIGVTGSL